MTALLGGANAPPLAARVAELAEQVSLKCDAASLDALRQLDTQTHARLDALSADVERLCLSCAPNDASALPNAARVAIAACVSTVRLDVSQAVEELSSRIARVESSSASAHTRGAAVGTPLLDSAALRSPALKHLMECDVEALEDRLAGRGQQRLRGVEEGLSK